MNSNPPRSLGKRHANRGLRKVCDCPRRRWLKCLHPWHINIKLPGGEHLRKSVDKIAGTRGDL